MLGIRELGRIALWEDSTAAKELPSLRFGTPPYFAVLGARHLIPSQSLCMMYQIKLQFGFVIDAGNSEEAFRKAVLRLRESPEAFVSGVYPAGQKKEKPGLLRRIVTGK